MVDNAEFDEIYVRYRGQISRYCLLKFGSVPMARELAEEAANDVFMALYERWDTLDRGEKLAAWLYKTARNVALNSLRVEKRRATQEYIEDFAAADRLGELGVTDEYFASRLGEEAFERHMKSVLDKDDYELFLRRYVKKQTFDRIAKESGVPYSTLRRRSFVLEKTIRREIQKFTEERSGG